MKKIVLLLLTAVFIATPALLFAQQMNNMIKKKNDKGRATQEEEYNQSKIDRLKMQQMKRIQQIMLMNSGQQRAAMDLNPGGFGNKGIVNSSVFRGSFGFSSFLNHRINSDMFLVGEIGYFFKSSNPTYASVFDRSVNEQLNGGLNSNVFEATLIPLYAGVRKGFFLNNMFKRFYPYIGAGAGPVVGMGFSRVSTGGPFPVQTTNRSFQVAPSAYALIGSEIYTNKRIFFDLSVRYRYLNFNNRLANWNNFSGFSIGLGFGYGLGKQLLR